MVFDQDTRFFVLHVDDESHSSYKLGEDIPKIHRLFARMGLGTVGERAIDMVVQFGVVQVCPSDGRILPIIVEPQRGNKRDLFELVKRPLVQLPEPR